MRTARRATADRGPAVGLIVVVEDLQFENVDFVWQPASDAPIDPERATLIDLRAARASFSECTFQAALQPTGATVAAICWNGPRRSRSLPPAGRLKLRGCVLCGVASGIAGRLSAPWKSTSRTRCFSAQALCSGSIAHRADEPMAITLANFTLRDATGLVCFQSTRTQAIETGNIMITTNDCVLSPDTTGAARAIRRLGFARGSSQGHSMVWRRLRPENEFAPRSAGRK